MDAITAAGTVISNTANATFKVDDVTTDSPSNTVNVTTVIQSTPSKIRLFQYSPGGQSAKLMSTGPGFQASANGQEAALVLAGPTSCRAGGAGEPFTPLGNPTYPGGSTLNTGGLLPLVATDKFHQGEPIFIELTDPDQNYNATARDAVRVTVNDPITRDREVLELSETAVNTGVFVGFIQSIPPASARYNCALAIVSGSDIKVDYMDPDDETDVSITNALVDPPGIVFDSSTGGPLNRTTVTIVDAATGEPATVFGDDGVSRFPSSIVSGESATDSGGTVYDFPPGGYRFPFVLPAAYRLVAEPADGFVAPSSVSIPDLQRLPGGPFSLDRDASFGDDFTVNAGPPLNVDIPVDPLVNSLALTKLASREQVAIGDFVEYRLEVTNTSTTTPAAGVVLTDHLPLGFRYQSGSVRVDSSAAPEPAVGGSGDILSFAVGEIAPSTTRVVTYVLNVSAGARLGDATNTAVASDARGSPSNTARATIRVQDDLLRSHSFILGRIMLGNCEIEHQPTVGTDLPGVRGIRLILEDGRYALTDEKGMYHFEGLKPGTHRVQVDLESLPDELEIQDCEQNTRFAGTPYAQFVDTAGGLIWRADFYVREKTPEELQARSPGESDEAQVAPLPALPEPVPERLPEINEAWFARATPELAWVAPVKDFHPSIPAIRIGVKHDPSLKPKLSLNGEPVSPLNYAGQIRSKDGRIAVSRWRGVDLIEGPNALKAVTIDKTGHVVEIIERTVHFSGLPVTAELAPAYSRLIADGKTPSVIAVRLRDQWGEPVREGVVGEFKLDPPFIPKQRVDFLQKEVLLDLAQARTTYHVESGGIARIALEPTTETGKVKLHLTVQSGGAGESGASVPAQPIPSSALDGREEIITAWLNPDDRDWILVGFGEDTVGYNTLSGNAEALDAAHQDDKLYDDGRLAFYAKGRVRGKWLLTVAYDSDDNGDVGSADQERLQQTIDPDEFYTLYGDLSEQRFDAPSSKKLYVRLERDQFYAMFGDYDTGLTVTELSRYSRSLTGLKTEFESDHYVLNAFAAQTDFAFVRDEILGNGTSGLYRLSRNDIVINSEKITIETRDRFHSEQILEARTLTRHIDYDIDYFNGTLFFKQPIFSKDENLNPIFIVAEYEVDSGAGDTYTAGGRGVVKFLDDKLELGVSAIHEGDTGTSNGDLQGADLTYQLTDSTRLRAELATSNAGASGEDQSGNAYLTELVHLGDKFDARAYLRKQEDGFGLGQQSETETGTSKGGVDGRYRFTEHLFADSELYREEVTALDAQRDVAFGQLTYQQDLYSLSAGARHANDRIDGENFESDLAVLGASKALFDKRLNLRAHGEFAVGQNANPDYPSRLILGSDYLFTPSTAAFVEQEFADGEDFSAQATRVGVRSSPWSQATFNTSMENQASEDGERLFANLGLTQGVQVNEHLAFDFGLDRTQTVREQGAPVFNPNVPPTSGTLNNDFTALSAGTNYTQDLWSLASRIEKRFAVDSDQFGAIFGFYRQQTPGLGFSLGGQYLDGGGLGDTHNTIGDARFSVAYRPVESHWIALDRLDFNYEEIDSGLAVTRGRKSINNLNLNWLPNRTNQIALHHGVKYVLDSFDSGAYDGWTQALDAEYRHDINRYFDIGIQTGILHSFTANNFQYSIGPSVGVNLVKNLWLSLGYNVRGFHDDDFATAAYTAQGPYIKLRFAFDQNSVHDALNWFSKTEPVSDSHGAGTTLTSAGSPP